MSVKLMAATMMMVQKIMLRSGGILGIFFFGFRCVSHFSRQSRMSECHMW